MNAAVFVATIVFAVVISADRVAERAGLLQIEALPGRRLSSISDSWSPSAINCTNAIYDCSNHGICTRAGDGCVCDDGYATHLPTTNVGCNYKRKKQLAAFLLQFFLGEFGAGHWYSGNMDLAGGQLAVTV